MIDYNELLAKLHNVKFNKEEFNEISNKLKNLDPVLTPNLFYVGNNLLFDKDGAIIKINSYDIPPSDLVPINGYYLLKLSIFYADVSTDFYLIISSKDDIHIDRIENFVLAQHLKIDNKIKPINSDNLFLYSDLNSNLINIDFEKIQLNTSKYMSPYVFNYIMAFLKFANKYSNAVDRLIDNYEEQLIDCINKAGYFTLPYFQPRQGNFEYIRTVFKVFDLGNWRVYFTNINNKYILKAIYHTDPLYQYIDANRNMLIDVDGSILAIFDLNVSSSFINTNGLNIEKIRASKNKNSLLIIDENSIFKFLNVNNENESKLIQMNNIIINKLLNDVFPKKYKNFLIGENFIEYDNNKVLFSSDTTKSLYITAYKQILATLVNRLNRHNASLGQFDYGEILNFNNILNLFYQLLVENIKGLNKIDSSYDVKWELQINTVSVVVLKKCTNGSISYYINNKRLKFNELLTCITRAMCYTQQSDYDTFINIISKCSLELHKVISKGITCHIDMPISESFYIKIPVVRERNKNYLVLKNKKVQINKIHQFIDQTSYIKLKNLCSIFNNENTNFFPNDTLTIDEIITLLNQGKQAYLDAIKKSKELLEKTKKLTDVKEHDFIETSNKRVGACYEVTGNSGTSYIVTESSNSCETYIWDKNQNRLTYLCIVDKSISDQVGHDHVVNRLFALKNDTNVKDKIHTLTHV